MWSSGLLKDSIVEAPIGYGSMRPGGSMCCLHEAGKGPKWVLGNVEIVGDFRHEILCVTVSATFPAEASGSKSARGQLCNA